MEHCLFVSGENVKEVWLETLLKVLLYGIDIKTEYDKPDEPASKDATVMIEIINPIENPIMIKGKKTYLITSKYGNQYLVFGHPADLYLIESIKGGYIEEMLDGTNDHLIVESKTSFPYSYHDRIFNYTTYGKEDYSKKRYRYMIRKLNSNYLPRIDQIEYIIQKLKESPYSRRAQAITWRPYSDPYHSDPPCLQRVWCRIINGSLIMETTWRSRDLFKAWSANTNAMLRIQIYIARKLGVSVGSYIDISNSLHIYGKDLKGLKDLLVRIYKKGDFNSKILKLLTDCIYNELRVGNICQI